jgi:hypothetical protein
MIMTESSSFAVSIVQSRAVSAAANAVFWDIVLALVALALVLNKETRAVYPVLSNDTKLKPSSMNSTMNSTKDFCMWLLVHG